MPLRFSCSLGSQLGRDGEERNSNENEDAETLGKEKSNLESEENERSQECVRAPDLYGESALKTKLDSEKLVPLTKAKRRQKKEFVINEEEEALPTYTRKTDRGGYSHTNLSKSRISKANAGNKPWNLGKRRSSADKAKIAAGVRARNRTILLQKLKRLGMTEEEYNLKKKEIKYLRERIRRAKLANGKHRDKKMERKLQDAIDATNDEKIVIMEEEKNRDEKLKDDKTGELKIKKLTGIFSKEISWRPTFAENDNSYGEMCPKGGPGGLICCDSCSMKYNEFLTRTSEDVETFRMIKESGEVTEILEILGHKKKALKDAVNTAKTKIPPLPPPGSGRLDFHADPYFLSRLDNINRKSGITNNPEKPEIRSKTWNLTSSIDIGFIGGFASV